MLSAWSTAYVRTDEDEWAAADSVGDDSFFPGINSNPMEITIDPIRLMPGSFVVINIATNSIPAKKSTPRTFWNISPMINQTVCVYRL